MFKIEAFYPDAHCVWREVSGTSSPDSSLGFKK